MNIQSYVNELNELCKKYNLWIVGSNGTMIVSSDDARSYIPLHRPITKGYEITSEASSEYGIRLK